MDGNRRNNDIPVRFIKFCSPSGAVRFFVWGPLSCMQMLSGGQIFFFSFTPVTLAFRTRAHKSAPSCHKTPFKPALRSHILLGFVQSSSSQSQPDQPSSGSGSHALSHNTHSTRTKCSWHADRINYFLVKVFMHRIRYRTKCILLTMEDLI